MRRFHLYMAAMVVSILVVVPPLTHLYFKYMVWVCSW